MIVRFGLITGGVSRNNVDVDALRREGAVSILAEPSLTARSGENASFLAGGELPFPADDGIVGIESRSFGVSLDFLPRLLPDERIAIRTRPELSNLVLDRGIAVAGVVVRALSIRRAGTTVEAPAARRSPSPACSSAS